MTFDEVLDQVRALLQQRGRVTYRSLKRRFDLDEEYVEDLKGELIRAEGVAADEDGDVLVWTGKGTEEESGNRGIGESGKKQTTPFDSRPQTLDARPTDGERRQLTVQFIDLVGSTTLSQQLDPRGKRASSAVKTEELHEVGKRPARPLAFDFHGTFAGIAA
jgi:class 3 adenylate cyclase